MHSTPSAFICSHFKECSGCSEQLSFHPPVWEEIILFFKEQVVPRLHQGSPIRWRHRAKLAVRGSTIYPLIGLFKQSSHEVFPIPLCLVHHPRLNQAFEIIKSWMLQHRLIPYQEDSGCGDLRYIQGVVQRKTNLIQLTFVLNTVKDSPKGYFWRKLLQQLGEEFPTLWHSLWINFNHRSTNTIFGSHWLHVWGEEWLWETFKDISVCYGPSSFGQANLPLFERMLVRLHQLIPGQARVTEFYAGVGVIGLFIASKCQWVKCSEINPSAEKCFNQARSQLSSKVAGKLTFYSSSTEKALFLLEEATTVIVDPPRKGLDPCFFSALKKAFTVKQLVYVSCGWEALQRDCHFLSLEGWRIQSVDGYAFFPGSNHIELLVNFERN